MKDRRGRQPGWRKSKFLKRLKKCFSSMPDLKPKTLGRKVQRWGQWRDIRMRLNGTLAKWTENLTVLKQQRSRSQRERESKWVNAREHLREIEKVTSGQQWWLVVGSNCDTISIKVRYYTRATVHNHFIIIPNNGFSVGTGHLKGNLIFCDVGSNVGLTRKVEPWRSPVEHPKF